MNFFKLVLGISLIIPAVIFSQDKLVKDLDFDGVNDSVYLDKQNGFIICKLSSQNFTEIKSEKIETYGDMSRLKSTKNGIIFSINWMRSGFENQFRYNKKSRTMQLIGMSRYDFGNAVNDGSGESSVNLLTSNYIGDWNFFDHLANNEEGESIKISIKTKMNIGFIDIQSFNDETYFNYSGLCAELFEQRKNKILKARGRDSIQ